MKRLLDLHSASMNMDRVFSIAKDICEVLEVPERIDELKRLLLTDKR